MIDKGDNLDEVQETMKQRIERIDGAAVPIDMVATIERLKYERDSHVELFTAFMQWYADRRMINRDANNENWKCIYDHFGIPKEEQHIWYCVEVNGVWIMKERDANNPHRKRVSNIFGTDDDDDEDGPGYVGGPAGPQE